jgi:hypothetical protein
VFKRLLVAVLLLLTAFGAVPAANAVTVTASHPHATLVLADCLHARYKPHTLIVACGDGNTVVKDFNYRTWTRDAATGTATLWFNKCDPDCARGKWGHVRMVFRLDHPVRVGKHLRFSRLVTAYPHRTGSERRQVYQLETRRL